MSELTPAEQQFFLTGELPPELATPTPPSPLDHAALSNQPAAPAPAPENIQTPPTTTPEQQPTPPVDVAEVLRRSLQDTLARQAQLEAQLAHLQQKATQPQPEQPPDPNVDPLGAMMHQINQVNRSVAELQAQLNQQTQQNTQLNQLQQFQQQVHQLRDQFVKTAPDFNDAYNHLRNVRAGDLRNYGLPDDQIQQALLQDEIGLAQQAIRFGRNPAQVIYEMAKNHGYTTKTQAAPAAPPSAKLQHIQQQPSSIPPAVPNTADITVDGLKAASDSDLNKLVMDDASWSKIVGRDSYPL